MEEKNKYKNRWITFLILVAAGEFAFVLPFVVLRYMRPQFLEAFDISNTDLAKAFSLYGITAMICYFPGGMLADKFSPKKLVSISLVLTGLGGFALGASIPKPGWILVFVRNGF